MSVDSIINMVSQESVDAAASGVLVTRSGLSVEKAFAPATSAQPTTRGVDPMMLLVGAGIAGLGLLLMFGGKKGE